MGFLRKKIGYSKFMLYDVGQLIDDYGELQWKQLS